MRDLFTKDFGWKMFSLMLAVAIWLTVNAISKDRVPGQTLGPSESFTFTNLPVLVVSEASDVRAAIIQPEAVAVTVRGRPDSIAELKAREIEVRVDLTGIESARLRKRIKVTSPPGIIVTRIEPADVDVVIGLPPNK